MVPALRIGLRVDRAGCRGDRALSGGGYRRVDLCTGPLSGGAREFLHGAARAADRAEQLRAAPAAAGSDRTHRARSAGAAQSTGRAQALVYVYYAMVRS